MGIHHPDLTPCRHRARLWRFRWRRLFVVGGVADAFFLEHVVELGGVEDLAADLAFDELGFLIAGDDADLWMLAGRGRGVHR